MRFLSVLAADLRFAIRMVRQNPAFSSVAILCLALGIGASSAIVYSLTDYPELERSAQTLEDIAARENRNAGVTSGLPESVRAVLFTRTPSIISAFRR